MAACSAPSGYGADSSDCDDGDAGVHPGATEFCTGQDEDCDGTVDEDDAADASTWYADSDSDGYGDAASTVTACNQPSGFVADSSDCDDQDNTINPVAAELCNELDDDCDGTIDEDDATDATTWYYDADGDGFGDPASGTLACEQPSGTIIDASDCDDSDSAVNPDASELCNELDDDCDGTIDEDDAVDAGTWYADNDGDGYGDPTSSTAACEQPTGFVADTTDCDDGDAGVNPAIEELCNEQDDDCDGTIDEDDAVDAGTWYADSDGDGYGDPGSSTAACEQPTGFVADATDCDDLEPGVNPDAEEIWYDGVDQDCDGASDYDQDGDGFDSEDHDGEDCDDLDLTINPDAEEYWYDGVDQDCDGASDYDQDGDGFDSESYGGDDCDDADASVYPGAPDDPYDGVINDCDNVEDYDADQDGFIAEDYDGDDCDDHNSAINPDAEEIWYDGVDQNCDGNDDDQDGDGYPLGEDCDDTDASAYPGAEGWTDDCEPIEDTGDTGDTGESVPPADTDTPTPSDSGEPGKDPGRTGCSSRSTPHGGLLLLGLGLGLLLVTRRRSL